MLNRDFKNILIIKPSSIGDIIHVIPFLDSIRARYPKAEITWLINSGFEGLIKDNPKLDGIILFERRRWGGFGGIIPKLKELARFIKEVRERRFDAVIDLQGLFRSGLIAYLSGSGFRAGFANARELSPIFYNYKVSHPPVEIHAVDRYLLIAKELGADINKKDFEINIPEKEKEYAAGLLSCIKKRPLIVINPSARWETKMWLLKRYAELIDAIDTDLNAQAVLIGSMEDEDRINELSSMSRSKPLNLCGKTNLPQLAAILKKADLLITNDSGPMHISAAVGTPVVAIFGPTRPVRTGPYGNGHVVLQSSLPCVNCLKKRCNDLKCMNAIAVNDVMDAVKEVLKSQ